MPDGVGGHHQFEGIEVLQDVPPDEVLAGSRAVLGLELGDGLPRGAGNVRS
jgi:hypothetical protein